MRELIYLVKRNIKIFFKDKGMFLSSMITPLILILLYITFLAKVYKSSILSFIPSDLDVSNKVVNGFVGGWLFSSLFAVCAVTISFCSNLLIIQDKHQNIVKDFNVTPVKKSILGLSYFISSTIVTLIICYSALIVGFIYLACVGWYLSLLDVILIILDIFIITIFGVSLSSIINNFLSTQGQMSAVGTTVSCTYGFICGAYMPISQFGLTINKMLMFLPSTYATNMIHNHFLNGVLDEVSSNYSVELANLFKNNFDLNLKFFNYSISNIISFLVIVITNILLVIIFIKVINKKKYRGV